jgi:peptidoglycan/LPS O-acetylase OafA/YrhL
MRGGVISAKVRPINVSISRGSKDTVAPSHRLPSIDGLRAISIILVLFGHLSGTRRIGSFILVLGDNAHLGVAVFFVISGFLITSLLLAEYSKYGGIFMKLFYVRRALRIFPASFCYLACILFNQGQGRRQSQISSPSR